MSPSNGRIEHLHSKYRTSKNTHWRITVSIQEELHSGTLRQARALALIMKSFTLSLMFWAFTSCRGGDGFVQTVTSDNRRGDVVEVPGKLWGQGLYRKLCPRPRAGHLEDATSFDPRLIVRPFQPGKTPKIIIRKTTR